MIKFSERFTSSPQFQEMFREGMALVEETAAYLDGDGRAQSRSLGRAVSLVYATESMRLTTRLMQLASWLLLHRAVQEGELTLSEASSEKRKVRLPAADGKLAGEHYHELPDMMRELIDRSLKLSARIMSADALMHTPHQEPKEQGNAVRQQIDRLSDLFSQDTPEG